MTRGHSLEQDLRLIINNPKYNDIEILCEDGKRFCSCRAILAARSEVFDRLLYNGMKESHERQIVFPEINSSGMEIILEYIYTGMIKEESLTKDNIVEAFNAADYFQLPDLQDFIMKNVKNILEKNCKDNYSPELLTKMVDAMPQTEDNDNALLNLLVEAVATIPLDTIEFGRLSIAALRFLLSYTREKENPFATPEYEVFRYSAILAAKQVSNDAYETLEERLPALKQEDSIQMESNFIAHRFKVAEELEPLIEFIDFEKIKGQLLVDIIEPLQIIPFEVILNVYREKIKSNNTDSNKTRGAPKNQGHPPPNSDNWVASCSNHDTCDSRGYNCNITHGSWGINTHDNWGTNTRNSRSISTRNSRGTNTRNGWRISTRDNWCNPNSRWG